MADQWDSNALRAWTFACAFLLLIQSRHAFEFRVGGSRGRWTVPADASAAVYNQWAERSRFQVGDALLFVYDGDHDSVLHVTEADYTGCNTAAPLAKFSTGHTSFNINQSGPFYFISGVADNCRKNEKLHVVVMAERGKHKFNEAVLPAPTSPDVGALPSPASPAVGALPPPPVPEAAGGLSPPPVGAVVPPSPAPLGSDLPPTPPDSSLAPSDQASPAGNEGSSMGVGGAGIMGALPLVLAVWF